MVPLDRHPMLNLLLSRPSAAKALFVSVAAHTAAASVLFAWRAFPTDRFAVSGQQSVISLTAVSTPPAPIPVVEKIEIDFPDSLDRPQEVTFERKLTHLRKQVESGEPTPPTQLRPVASIREFTDAARRAVDIEEVEIQEMPPVRRPRKLTKHQSVVPPLPSVVGVDQQSADLSNNPSPKYPAESVRLRHQGTVMLRLFVDAEGRVDQVELVKSSGHHELDQSAILAVQKWRGQPATRAGVAVASTEILPVRFRL